MTAREPEVSTIPYIARPYTADTPCVNKTVYTWYSQPEANRPFQSSFAQIPYMIPEHVMDRLHTWKPGQPFSLTRCVMYDTREEAMAAYEAAVASVQAVYSGVTSPTG